MFLFSTVGALLILLVFTSSASCCFVEITAVLIVLTRLLLLFSFRVFYCTIIYIQVLYRFFFVLNSGQIFIRRFRWCCAALWGCARFWSLKSVILLCSGVWEVLKFEPVLFLLCLRLLCCFLPLRSISGELVVVVWPPELNPSSLVESIDLVFSLIELNRSDCLYLDCFDLWCLGATFGLLGTMGLKNFFAPFLN